MGGVQHYIPRLVLRRFASRFSATTSFVWCFRAGQEPFEPAIEGVGGERKFYSEGVDEQLSSAEQVLVRQLDALDSVSDETEVDGSLAAGIVVSLLLRSRNTRFGTSSMFSTVMEKVLESIEQADPKELLGLYEKKDGPVEDPPLRRLLTTKIPEFLRDTRSALDERGFLNTKSAAEGPGRLAHLEALKRDFAPAVDRFSTYRWQKVSTEAVVILGDVVAVCTSKDNEGFLPGVLATPGVNHSIYLPIGPNKLLKGSSSQAAEESTTSEINRASARLSESFFVASACTDETALLHGEIGRHFGQWEDLVHKELTEEQLRSFRTE